MLDPAVEKLVRSVARNLMDHIDQIFARRRRSSARRVTEWPRRMPGDPSNLWLVLRLSRFYFSGGRLPRAPPETMLLPEPSPWHGAWTPRRSLPNLDMFPLVAAAVVAMGRGLLARIAGGAGQPDPAACRHRRTGPTVSIAVVELRASPDPGWGWRLCPRNDRMDPTRDRL